jgi:hypothetical protein
VKVNTRWTRSAAVLAAAIVPLAGAASASAAPLRTASLTDYTTADYLQDTLGLPSSEVDPAIEPVTYDHFQWLLQQPGSYAILIGDPATDASFATRAQDAEAAADAAGVERVYWFNPNLSGNARVGDVTQPNLDIRVPSGITSLSTTGQTTFGYAWLNLVGRHLGNGVDTVAANVGADSTRITATTGTSAVNDAGATAGQSTEVGDADGGALYDYATATPADVSHSYFLVYDKDSRTAGGQPLKIVAWVDLTDAAGSTAARADVATAIGRVGGANLATPDQFDWWKSAANARQLQASPNPHQGPNVPVLTDADDADGWRIEQITYPELVHLLDNDATVSKNAVIFFGGTWCTNTRPVLPAINRYAQQNDVRVFNFDTVLDGANVGGGATSGANPLQSRNTVAASGGTASNNASFIYGELFDHFLGNAVTQYAATNRVTYYREGRESNPVVSTQRLQVPYLVGYQGSASAGAHGGVTRQWISDNGDGTYREFMSNWWLVNPQANQLGISTIPLNAPIWARVNQQLTTFSWRTDLATVVPNTGTDSDDADYLVDTDTASVTYSSSNGGRITIASGGSVPASPAALTAALATLGASAPANLAELRTQLIAAHQASDTATIDKLTPLAGPWGLAQLRKYTLSTAWSNVAFGQRAVRAAELFFGGLPGGVVSTQTVTADAVKQGTAPKITVAIANEYGRTPTGDVTVVVKQAGATVATGSAAVAGNAASVTLPALAAGTYDYELSYQGDDQIAGFTKSGTLTVTPADVVPDPEPRTPVVPLPPAPQPPVPPAPNPPSPPSAPTVRKVKAKKVAGAIAKAATRTKAGTYKVTVTSASGAAKATGTVRVTLKKGKATKVLSGRLTRGTVTLKLPKLARGTWKVTIAWQGDARHLASSATGAAVKIK